VGANIAPGETYVMYFELPSESVPSQMSVRIQDDGVKYLAEGSYLDCDSTNNTGLIGYDQLFDDVATVQAFRQVEIDVLANDKLPSGFPPGTFSLLDSVPPGYRPLNGTLSVSGSKLVYTSAGTEKLTNHIDSFTYRLSFVSNGVPRTDSATVYIYVLYDENGASACPAPQSYTAVLTEKPAGVTFNWYLVGSTTTPIATGATYNFGALAGDASREVKPVVPGAGAPWNRAGGFPPGRFTVHATGTAPAPMRWTGIENSDWFNPANWVEVRATYETPVSWTPSRCTNVVISSGAPNYPELSGPAFCAGITMEDRAMLKNPHALNYDSARVEVRFSALEYDRFVMWSAPLRDMYSGDYHFTDAGGRPRWGDVAINYFQQDNPHGGEARANMFTATFGEPGEPLGLGKAFNLRVTATSESRSQPLIFPQKATGYEYTDPASGSNLFTAPLSRSNSRLFITDGVTLDAEERFEMTVPGISGGEMVQIVNPYLAYLRADSFLEGNRSSSTLATSGYLLWDGKVDNSFVAVKFAGDPEYREGMRYMATRANALSSSPEYIPPLQSFFVVKNSANATVNTVKMSPRWTTTKLPGAYQLLMSEAGSGVLRIRATQGRSESYAALHFDKNQAAPEYRSSEDVRALFYTANPLTVYVLTPLGEPLAISADGEYESHVTPLGLRLTQSGEVTLEFSGLAHFGHNVYLVDREQNREIDLQQTPAYTFMAVKPSGVEALELNDRFVLRMEYTGVSSEPAPVSPTWTALPLNGEIHVRAVSGLIRSLQVYNVLGAQVYATQTAGDHYRIPVERGQIYIVRADINGVGETKKVIVN
jgi:hypothetical protein